MLILRACCRHCRRKFAPQCAGTNPSINPITMKITNADTMMNGNKNLSIFIRNGPPAPWMMVLEKYLLGYQEGHCE